MSIALDSSFVLAVYNRRDANHATATELLARTDEDLVSTPLTIAELDYFIGSSRNEALREAFWTDLDAGVWGVRWWADALSETLGVVRRHPFAGLTDASLVALAGVLRTNRIATFDDHFRSMKTPRGDAFVLLPDDA